MRRYVLLISAVLISAHASAEVDPRCPTRDHVLLDEAFVNPAGLDAFVHSNAEALKDPGDLICCLPRSYRSKFAIINSSISAQSSDVYGSRVILFSPARTGVFLPQLKSAISINGGGAANLSNRDNAEVAYNDPHTGELALYDLNFRDAFDDSKVKNPQACLSCHGSSTGQLALGGPKPIFEDSDEWTRAVQGVHACSAVEEKLSRSIESTVERSFRTNPRYRCLDLSAAHEKHFAGNSTSTSSDLSELDNMLEQINDRRVAKLIHVSPKYDVFKHAIAGALSCFEFDNCASTSPNDRPRAFGCNASFEKWIPSETLNRMSDVRWVDPRLNVRHDLLTTVHVIFDDSFKDWKKIEARQLSIIEALDRGENPPLEFYRGPLSTCNDFKGIDTRLANLRAKITGSETLDLFKADGEIRSVRGHLMNPFYRFIFASRGIDINAFSMDPIAELYTRSPVSGLLTTELLKLEPYGTPLYRLKSVLIDAQLALPDQITPEIVMSYQRADKALVARRQIAVCGQLRRLSFKALSEPP